MPRTASGLRTGPAARLAELEQRRPEWHSWIAMLSEVERAVERESRLAAPNPGPENAPPGLQPGTPLLHRQSLPADPATIQGLFLRLAALAAGDQAGPGRSLRTYRPGPAEVLCLVAAAVRQDGDAIEAIASRREVDPGTLASVAHLAAFPLLLACGSRLERQVPRHWPHGYCPVCAGWPTLAERRGLDRTRRLRCGRCGSGWEVPSLWCIYCGERDHERLGSLVPDQQGEMLKVETCAGCRGYLKSVATLQAIPPFELLLQDLETVELDLIALDRGYSRPATNGFNLEVTV